MNTHKTFNLIIAFVFAFSLLGMPATAFAEEYSPSIAVDYNQDAVALWGWTLGTELNLTIDAPANGTGIDYTTSMLLGPGNAAFYLGYSFDIQPGDVVTVTDGITTGQVTVTDVRISGANPDTDTAYGEADPFDTITVYAFKTCDFQGQVVTADQNGNWVANFAGICDLIGSTTIMATEMDENNGVTRFAFDLPTFTVYPRNNSVDSFTWQVGNEVTLTIDDPANGAGVDYTDIETALPVTQDRYGSYLNFDLGTLETHPGDLLTMTDGTTTKTSVIANLVLGGGNVNNDRVWGTADPGDMIQVSYQDNYNVVRNVIANADGNWMADFSIPGDEPGEEVPFDIRPGNIMLANQKDGDGDQTQLQWRATNPRFSVIFPKNEIHGYEWSMGANLTLTIDDPLNGTGVDYSRTKTVGTENFKPPFNTWIGFELGEFMTKPGDIVTMTDGVTTKTHVTQELTVTNVDPETDTASGTAAPGTDVGFSGGCDNNGCAYRNVPVDASGHWLVDFSVPGDQDNEQQLFDIRLGSSGAAQRIDEDGDETVYDWNVGDPNIYALLEEQRVYAWGWLAGTPLTLTIENPATPQSPDYTGTQAATAFDDWDYGFDWGITLDVQPGYLVTVSGGGITKELEVAPLTVTAVDIDADTVSGTGDPGFMIHVGMLCDDNSCTRRNIYVDANGNWFADFSVPGHDDDETVFDIRLGSGTGVYEIDEDNDATSVGWDVPNHTFSVRANDDRIEGSEWILGSTITIEIDDPSTETNPDYTDTATVGLADWDPSQTYFGINTEGYDLKLGDMVTVTDGDITKQLTVSNFMITDVDLETDLVHGIADPGQHVNIWTCWQNDPCINRDETADQDGNWVTNFAVPGEQDWEQATADLRAGSWIDSSVSDEDSDSTMFGWYVDIPNIEANTGNDGVVARGWPNGTSLTLTIDDPSNGPGVDKTMYATMGPSSWDSNDIAADFTTFQDFDLQPGHILKVTDGITEATYVPTNLTVTGFDLEADTISGIAQPGIEVVVWVGVSGPHILRYVTADALTGYWIADYGHPGQRDDEQQLVDLQPGSVGFVKDIDANGSSTHVDWRVPNPNIVVRPLQDFIDGWGWPDGANVLLTLDDPVTPQSPDYTETQTASYSADWRPEDTLARFVNGAFDIKPGQVVTLTDDVTTRTHIVTKLAVTGFNVYNDTVYGTADPFATISNVNVCDDSHCSERTAVADEFGNWTTDFSISGDINHPETIDIRTGTEGIAIQSDDDGDATHIGWEVRGPLFMLNIYNDSSWHELTAWNWPLGSQVTLTVDDPSTPQSPDYTEIKTMSPRIGSYFTGASYMQNNEFEGHPGFTITLSDGIQTKTMFVHVLEVTGYDLDADTINGISAPFTTVVVPISNADGSKYAERTLVTDSEGNWLANFAVSNDPNEAIYDVQPGDSIEPQIYDEDQDHMVLRDWGIPALQYAPFVVFGEQGVWIKENSDVLNGDVAANVMSEGPYLTDQSEVTIGQDVHFMDAASRVIGDTVYLKQGSRVYDIYANQLKGSGQILGIFHTPLTLPIVSQLPAVPNVSPGTQNFDLKKNSTLTLDAGSYGKLETKKGATITFTGGVYHFTEWSLGDDVKVYFTAPAEIRIAGKLDIGSDAFVGPASGTQLTASDILIYVLGENGKNGKINASPKAAKFGTKTTLIANVYTPNGTLWIRENSKATGAFFGKWVEIGQNVTLTLDNGWR